MNDAPAPSPWTDAMVAAALFAVDPGGTGGVAVRAHAGPARERWLESARQLLPGGAPLRRIPLHVTDGRLLGGLDLAATLRAGRPVAERGLLTEADGGVVVLPMAERLAPSAAARITAAQDAGEVVVERDGIALRTPARFGVILLDEGVTDDERPPAALMDRLAFHVDLTGLGARDAPGAFHSTDEVSAARTRLPRVTAGEDVLEALCGAAMTLGIASLRASQLALKAARAAAALAGRDAVTEEDAAIAARLVLGPRAAVLPVMAPPAGTEDTAEPPPLPERGEDAPGNDESPAGRDPSRPDRPLEDVVLEAARAAIPAGLLALLKPSGGGARARAAGRAGALKRSAARGRPAGVRRGELRSGARLNVIETLRAAAPWQPLRRREARAGQPRVEVRCDDFRITRFKHRSPTTTIFAVDASGSAALHRLAEAKGAVELLLADCYVRRDQVALIAFRGQAAELLLPPTRSLVRAKRSLAGLPGGGGTPLAAGIDTAAALADAVRRRGNTPVVVVLTDGRANIGLDGTPGRPQAEADALAAARRLRAAGFTALLVDTSPRPQAAAQRLAAEMGARYLPLPYADAAGLSLAVQIAAHAPAAAA
ncbi:MAG: magnesium chelatase subunit D [Pseudomonadota bacterium]